MDQPHFNICVPVDITGFPEQVRQGGHNFTAAVAYALSRAANEIPEFRQRIRQDKVVEHTRVHPSFTVSTETSGVFSFCEVDFDPDCHTFLVAAARQMADRYRNPVFENQDGRDDYLFMSAFPWASFTGLTHAMHYTPADSVPRITWGKYDLMEGRTRMPVAVLAHHALVDGRQVGAFFQSAEALFRHSEEWLP